MDEGGGHWIVLSIVGVLLNFYPGLVFRRVGIGLSALVASQEPDLFPVIFLGSVAVGDVSRF